jgi:thiamine biosynthesis lipoprotein
MTLAGNIRLFLFLLTLFILSCESNLDKKANHRYYEINGSAQGTSFTIVYEDSSSRDFSYKIDSLLKQIDDQLSTYDSSSFISKFNSQNKFSHEVDGNDLFIECFNRSKYFHKTTNGYFNPAIFPLVEYWGFHNSNKVDIDTIYIIDSILPLIQLDDINIISNTKNAKIITKKNKNSKLDFNAIAQGYSVDLVAAFLNSNAVENYMVEIGGEVTARGINSKGNIWRIGIERPVEGSFTGEFGFQKIISLDNKSLATSGNYRKFKNINGIKVSHTINPLTGFSVINNLLSVSVITDYAADADALATSLMAMGMNNSIKFINEYEDTTVKVYFIYDSLGTYGEWSNF